MNHPPIVRVKWLDAWTSEKFYYDDTEYTGAPIYSTGFICEENDEGLILSGQHFPPHLGDEPLQRRISFIPWGMVENWWDVS